MKSAYLMTSKLVVYTGFKEYIKHNSSNEKFLNFIATYASEHVGFIHFARSSMAVENRNGQEQAGRHNVVRLEIICIGDRLYREIEGRGLGSW